MLSVDNEMSQSEVRHLSVLLLGATDRDPEPQAWVQPHWHVTRVATFEEALTALHAKPFDLVVSRAADFLPFQNIHFSGQAAAIIDNVDQGVAIVNETGALDWANSKLLSFPQDVRDFVTRCCIETFAIAKDTADGEDAKCRRDTYVSQTGESFEITATPVTDPKRGVTEVAAVVREATNAKRLQHKIDAIDQAGRELLNLDTENFAQLDTQQRLSLLEQKVLRCTEDLLHFDNFVIFVLDKKNNKLEPMLVSRMPEDRAHTELYGVPEGNGVCGYVAARGRSYICSDTSKDPRYVRGIDKARSSLSVPLRLRDQVVGVANFESTKLAAFSEDDRQFAEIFGRYLALSLQILELLVCERRTTTGQLGTNVMAEITGPLNDILTEAENLIEDYIGHDDLRHRIRVISENAVKIRESIKHVTSEKPGLIGVRSSKAQPNDPALDGKRILLADDEEIIRDTVRDVLCGHGCDVTVACDGTEALALLADASFDLVLSDIKMPGKSGYDVFAATKEINSDTPVMLMTGFGYDPNHTIVRARREGLAAVLFKPFKVDQLVGEVRTALQNVTK